MNAAERQPFLDAVDRALEPLGLKRPRSGYEWRRKVDRGNTAWVHLNFGLGVINPSFGVRYTDLAEQLPAEMRSLAGVGEILSAVSGTAYSIDTPSGLLAGHILRHAVPRLEQLADRTDIVRRLKLDRASEWPVLGAAARMRLLPLLLAADGRRQEALIWLSYFEIAGSGRDQILPSYDGFAAWFRKEYGQLQIPPAVREELRAGAKPGVAVPDVDALEWLKEAGETGPPE